MEPLITLQPRWRRLLAITLRRRSWLKHIERLILLTLVLTLSASYLILANGRPGERLLAPQWSAFLLIANLIPSMMLLVVLGRRVALRRAKRAGLSGGGRLHVRLVAIFSTIAAVPMLLMVLFASLLFQYGTEFWLSDKAKSILQNASAIGQSYDQMLRGRVTKEAVVMAGDLRNDLQIARVDDPRFTLAYAAQVFNRSLSESAIIQIGNDGVARTLSAVNPYERSFDNTISRAVVAQFQQGATTVSKITGDRVEAITPLNLKAGVFLFAARKADPADLAPKTRIEEVYRDYGVLVERSRRMQLYFNAALFLISLTIVGVAVIVALRVADRLVRPVDRIVDAANRVSSGDLHVRVAGPLQRDEIGTLACAFNTMTERLSAQTDALVGANALLERRRALTEAVLAGVSAGVIAVTTTHDIRLINNSARTLLSVGDRDVVGLPLRDLSPELDAMLVHNEHAGIKAITSGTQERTLAVNVLADEGGHVLTFDDITTQINDQRRAAWADVARRIAHEIKNPLTPIQLAAERLQRRFAREINSDPATYGQLTDTIIRQVGDLRRMVDEFSSFARIPKPVFRAENLVDIIRQAIFLHEVAHPNIRFALVSPEPIVPLVCDRRQLSQALINIVKNAVEAIEEKPSRAAIEAIAITLGRAEPDKIIIKVEDSGVGLPQDRARLAEPYVTTRERGTGLGLAIVQKIIEDHCGTLNLGDRPSGGSIVTIAIDQAALNTRISEHMNETL